MPLADLEGLCLFPAEKVNLGAFWTLAPVLGIIGYNCVSTTDTYVPTALGPHDLEVAIFDTIGASDDCLVHWRGSPEYGSPLWICSPAPYSVTWSEIFPRPTRNPARGEASRICLTCSIGEILMAVMLGSGQLVLAPACNYFRHSRP